jgi:hypothetical protein
VTDPDEFAARLAAESLAAGDPTGWFERLYEAAAEGSAVVPWVRAAPHPALVEWFEGRGLGPAGRRAVVVGCGWGADAEYVAGLGYDTTAFDVSASAVRTVRARYPDSPVRYLVADLLDPPAAWDDGFDLVVECFTVQSLPPAEHPRALGRLARLVGAGGTLILVAAGSAEAPVDGPPWPLTRAEVDALATHGLDRVRVEELPHPVEPTWYRVRAEFRRP